MSGLAVRGEGPVTNRRFEPLGRRTQLLTRTERSGVVTSLASAVSSETCSHCRGPNVPHPHRLRPLHPVASWSRAAAGDYLLPARSLEHVTLEGDAGIDD